MSRRSSGSGGCVFKEENEKGQEGGEKRDFFPKNSQNLPGKWER